MKRRGKTEDKARKIRGRAQSGKDATPKSAMLQAALYFIRKRRRRMLGSS
jgi:hypothetical protein